MARNMIMRIPLHWERIRKRKRRLPFPWGMTGKRNMRIPCHWQRIRKRKRRIPYPWGMTGKVNMRIPCHWDGTRKRKMGISANHRWVVQIRIKKV